MKKLQLDIYDYSIMILIASWFAMAFCLAFDWFTGFWVLLAFNCVCTPSLGVILRNITTRK